MRTNGKKFKLIDISFKYGVELDVCQLKNGFKKYGWMRIEPNKEYEMFDDELFEKSLENQVRTEKYSKERENELKEKGIPYKVTYCHSCGGNKKLKFNPVAIYE